MSNPPVVKRSAILPVSLIVLGFILAVGWTVMIVPPLAMAESGRGLNVSERLLVSAPMAIASALMIIGALLGNRLFGDSNDVAGGGLRALFVAGMMLGGVAALATLGLMLG